MYVGIARLSVVIAQSHSLKEKRMVIRRVKDRVRERVGVAINEVGEHDIWQRAELGCSVTSSDRAKAYEVLDEIVRVAAAAMVAGDAQLVAVAKDVIKFDAAAAPVAEVDDRTGAGDKAVGAKGDGDWIPDEWREEAES
ncbi:MAG: hypothetical protein JWP01_1771 [Myxococcales bacterium]|nr:hypothetical protein [Myxococcales bacterium]